MKRQLIGSLPRNIRSVCNITDESFYKTRQRGEEQFCHGSLTGAGNNSGNPGAEAGCDGGDREVACWYTINHKTAGIIRVDRVERLALNISDDD